MSLKSFPAIAGISSAGASVSLVPRYLNAIAGVLACNQFRPFAVVVSPDQQLFSLCWCECLARSALPYAIAGVLACNQCFLFFVSILFALPKKYPKTLDCLLVGRHNKGQKWEARSRPDNYRDCLPSARLLLRFSGWLLNFVERT